MKKLLNTVLCTCISLTMLLAFNGDPKTVNVSASEIKWKAYKVTGSHEGTIDLKSGELVYNEDGALTGGTFVLDMNSISCTDLQGEYQQKLIGHLKSDDFFSVEAFPTSTLEITKVSSRGIEGAYKVVADLTIKGITNQIKFNVTTEDDNHKTKLSIDRSDYDVRYGSGSFFDNLGDNTIYDEFDIEILVSGK